MGKSTIKFYEKLKTESLRTLLTSYETAQFNVDYINSKSNDDRLEEKIVDYDIDISLIRMELNKRLWKESN